MGIPESRVEPRFNLKWKIALAVDQGGTMRMYQGEDPVFVVDRGGSASGSQSHSGKSDKCLALVAADNEYQRTRCGRMQACIVYVVLSSSASHFRVGLQFVKFKNDDQKILANRLAFYAQGQLKKSPGLFQNVCSSTGGQAYAVAAQQHFPDGGW
jgi:hypothetical protein